MTRRHPNVVNVEEADPWSPPGEKPPRFGATARRLGSAAGAKALGCTHFRVPAGKTAVPLHAHFVNEEAVYVLEGEGTLRIGKERVLVHAGDWIAMPPGEEHAHQLIADRGVELAYLCVSTTIPADVVTYPDSKKLLATAAPPGASPVRKIFFQKDGDVPYFAGEDAEPKP